MATFNKFNCFTEDLCKKKHDLNADTIMVALTNSAPSATNTVLANITQISHANLSSRTISKSLSQSSGQTTLALTDLVLTASGTVPQWRYAVIYNETATNDELIGWVDYGSAVDMTNGQTMTLDFAAASITVG